MPFVTIEWFEGRSDEQKREIAQKVTEVLADVGKMPADQVWIRFEDASKADWAIGGLIQADGRSGGGHEPTLGPPD